MPKIVSVPGCFSFLTHAHTHAHMHARTHAHTHTHLILTAKPHMHNFVVNVSGLIPVLFSPRFQLDVPSEKS